MRKLLFGGAAALILSLGWAHAEEPQSCTLVEAATVELKIGEGGLPTIPVKMNGRDERLLVDTGAPVSLISAGYVVELQLPRKPFPQGVFVLANGTSPAETANVDTLSVGRLTGRNTKFFILPSRQMPSSIAGSFGADFLRAWDVDFDFGGNKFNLISPKHCKGKVVYWTKEPFAALPVQISRDQHLRVNVNLDGRKLRAVIDTGSTSSVMSLALAKRLYNLHDEELLPRTAYSAIGPQAQLVGPIYERTFETLDFDGLLIKRPPIVLARDLDLGDEQLIIGMSSLKKMHLYVAYKERVVYATGADTR